MGLAVSALMSASLSIPKGPGCPVSRKFQKLGDDGLWLIHVTFTGVVLFVLAFENTAFDTQWRRVKLVVDAKVMLARTSAGLLKAQDMPESEAQKLQPCNRCGRRGHWERDCPQPANSRVHFIRPQWRYAAKWKRFETEAAVCPGKQRIAMILIANGMQAEMGNLQASVDIITATNTNPTMMPSSQTLPWASSARNSDPFEVQLLLSEEFERSRAEHIAHTRLPAVSSGDYIDDAREASLAQMREAEERLLDAALLSSAVDAGQADERRLAEVLAASASAARSQGEWRSNAVVRVDLIDDDLEMINETAANREVPSSHDITDDDQNQLQKAIQLSLSHPKTHAQSVTVDELGAQDEALERALRESRSDAARCGYGACQDDVVCLSDDDSVALPPRPGAKVSYYGGGFDSNSNLGIKRNRIE